MIMFHFISGGRKSIFSLASICYKRYKKYFRKSMMKKYVFKEATIAGVLIVFVHLSCSLGVVLNLVFFQDCRKQLAQGECMGVTIAGQCVCYKALPGLTGTSSWRFSCHVSRTRTLCWWCERRKENTVRLEPKSVPLMLVMAITSQHQKL